jgi:hypothetical protein
MQVCKTVYKVNYITYITNDSRSGLFACTFSLWHNAYNNLPCFPVHNEENKDDGVHFKGTVLRDRFRIC